MNFLEKVIKKFRYRIDTKLAKREFKKITGYEPNQKQLDFYMGKAFGYIFDRREGKTIAIIAKALKEASKGETIFIVCSHQRQCKDTVNILNNLSLPKRFKPKKGFLQIITEEQLNRKRFQTGSYIYDLIENKTSSGEFKYVERRTAYTRAKGRR